MKEHIFNLNSPDYMKSCIEFITDELKKSGIEQKELLKTELLCEESILKLSEYAKDDADISIRVVRDFGNMAVEIKAKGEEVEELSKDKNITYSALSLDDDTADIDSGVLILKANSDIVNYSYDLGTNFVRIRAGKKKRNSVYLTLDAMFLAIVLGLICRYFAPKAFNDAFCNMVLAPIKTMFINALKIIVGPVVFFSIVTCVSGFTNLAELGKIGVKVMGMYLMTTVIAIFLGFGSAYIVSPGEWGMALENEVDADSVDVDTDVDTSLISTITNIVPDNIIAPFAKSDTLQIIFIAILLGAAVGMIGSYSKVLRDIFAAFNELFLMVTSLIAKLIPIAAFCSLFIMVCNTGSDSLFAMLGLTVTVIGTLFVMMLIYALLILVLGGLNPIIFFKKNWRGMLTAFSLSSSNASMPINIDICTNDLGISPKVCNFSIPLGATINMDGFCVNLAIVSMFLAKIYAVEVPTSSLLSLSVTTLLLSLGAPGIPGVSLVCIGVLLQHVGVPMEAIGLIIGVDALIDMFRTVSNTTGDMAVTLIVAKKENLLDMKKYLS